jgi:hypothetical protein
MGGTGNLRTLRISGANGSRTFMSMIANGSNSGAGSTRRMYGYFAAANKSPSQFYSSVFGIRFGEFKNNAQYFIGRQ